MVTKSSHILKQNLFVTFLFPPGIKGLKVIRLQEKSTRGFLFEEAKESKFLTH